MKLFQSIFGRETRQHYPDSLIEMAIERAIDGTDSRLRLLPGYRKRLRAPVITAIDHVIALVDAIQAPLPARARQHGTEPRLSTVFSSAGDMLEILARDPALTRFLTGSEGTGAGQVTALLMSEPVERNILGLDLVGDQVRRDVPQVTVNFTAHRLLDPTTSESESRRLWKRRAFDHLLTLALNRIAATKIERVDLARQRDLLRRKLKALERGGWSFEPAAEGAQDPAALVAELDAITAQLGALGANQDVLQAHLGIVGELLADAPAQLWAEPIAFVLDPMNIQRAPDDPSARRIEFLELRNAQGRRVVALPLTIVPADLPEREDLVSAASRYLQ
ncbi:hypothetical protein [Allochromatium palmeri]|uniref:Uncharacterized protein n=1 Tax=Allochromatium palmeri TaxID=231048 RepID=A0A6N8E8J3_9GAMM|nr:hypothetical protein [Allochromatium palmeri]MTW20593.1 hypothetical protein [Allochromatium palmeri]